MGQRLLLVLCSAPRRQALSAFLQRHQLDQAYIILSGRVSEADPASHASNCQAHHCMRLLDTLRGAAPHLRLLPGDGVDEAGVAVCHLQRELHLLQQLLQVQLLRRLSLPRPPGWRVPAIAA